MFVPTHVRTSLFLYGIAVAMAAAYCVARLYSDRDYGTGSNDNEYQTFSYGGIAHAFLFLAIGIRSTNLILTDRATAFAEIVALGVASVWSVSAAIVYYISDNATGPEWLDRFAQVYLLAIASASVGAGVTVVLALPSTRSAPASKWVLSPVAVVAGMVSSGVLATYVLVVGSIMLMTVGDAMWSYSVFVIGLPTLYVGSGIRNVLLFDKRPWGSFVRCILFGVALASVILGLTRNAEIHRHVKVGGFTIWFFDIGMLVCIVIDAVVWAICDTMAVPEKKTSDDIPLLEQENI